MLSQASTYAIRALQWVANQQGRTVGIGAAAARGKMPVAYLAKIVNQLARRKIVLTQRGVGGGVLLARPASQITLFDLCEAMGDDVLKPRCMLGNVHCTNDPACPAHSVCRSARERLTCFLRRTTVADVAAFEAGRKLRRKATGARRKTPA